LRWSGRVGDSDWNWALQLRQILQKSGFGHIMDLTLEQMKIKLPNLIIEVKDKMETNCKNYDMAKVLKSKWTPDYAKLKCNFPLASYINQTTTTWASRMMAQARVNLFRLKWKQQSVPLQDKKQCPWCLDEQGNLDHYLWECQNLNKPREILSPYMKNTDNINFINIQNYNMYNKKFYSDFFIFWVNSFSLLTDST
jgi:hypothetical protein